MPHDFRSTKIIFIDWYKTLSFHNFWNHFMYDGRKDIYNKVAHSLYLDDKDLINKWMRGNIDCDHILDKINADTSYSKDFLEGELIKSCKEMDICEKSVELIKKIRNKGVKVALASDNMDVFRKYTVPALNLSEHFDDLLLSNELGCLKSDILNEDGKEVHSPFFSNFLNQHRADYSQSVLIDDNIENSVNEKYGMNFLRVEEGDGSTLKDYLEKILTGI